MEQAFHNSATILIHHFVFGDVYKRQGYDRNLWVAPPFGGDISGSVEPNKREAGVWLRGADVYKRQPTTTPANTVVCVEILRRSKDIHKTISTKPNVLPIPIKILGAMLCA